MRLVEQAVAMGIARLLQPLPYEVALGNPTTLVVVTLLLIFVAVFGGARAGRRTAAMDPMIPLRYE